MATRRNTKFVLDILVSRISLLALSVLTAWLGISVAKEMYQKHQVNKEIAHLQQEILDLTNKNNDLASFLDLFDDPNTVELEAKRRLNLKKPGEKVVVILRDKNNESQNIVQSGSDISHQGASDESEIDESAWLANPLKWWQYITNIK